MGICEILTIIFVLAKVFGFVKWSWPVVFIPEIIAVVIYTAISIWYLQKIRDLTKETNELFDDFEK